MTRGTFVLDSETRIRRVEPWLAERLGWRPEALVGRRLSTVVDNCALATVGAVLGHAVRRAHDPSLPPAPPGVNVPAACVLRARDGRGVAAMVRARYSPAAGFDIEVWTDGEPPVAGPVGDATGTEARPAAAPATAPAQLGSPVFDEAPVACAAAHPDGALVVANTAWRRLFAAPDDPLGAPAASLGAHLDDAEHDRVDEAVATLVADGGPVELEVRCRRADDSRFWCRLRASRWQPGDGAPLVLWVANDVTARHHHQRELASSEALFRTVSETSPVGIARLTPDLRFAYANPRWREIAPLPGGAGHVELASLVHPDDHDRVRTELERRRTGSITQPIQCRLRPDGSTTESDDGAPTDSRGPRWVNLRITPLLAGTDAGVDTDTVVGHVATLEDITELVTARESTERLAGIVESTSDLVGIADPGTGRLVYLNRAARVLFDKVGVPADAITLDELYTRDAVTRWADDVAPALRLHGAWTGELPMHTPDGDELHVLHSITAELGADGHLERVSALGRDVTHQYRLQEELAWRATHDALTGLPNRALLLDRLGLALARSTRDSRPVALLFCDLDGFKQVNDTLGHDAGDELLRQVATRLTGALRPSDTVARLGGDEFVMLCPDIADGADVMTIAHRVVDVVADPGYPLGTGEGRVSVSVGLAVADPRNPGDAELPGPAELLRRADTAMYAAKEAGKNRVLGWVPSLG